MFSILAVHYIKVKIGKKSEKCTSFCIAEWLRALRMLVCLMVSRSTTLVEKYLKNCWMDCYEIFFHSWSPEDKSYWLWSSRDFTSCATSRLTFLFAMKYCTYIDNSGNLLMFPFSATMRFTLVWSEVCHQLLHRLQRNLVNSHLLNIFSSFVYILVIKK